MKILQLKQITQPTLFDSSEQQATTGEELRDEGIQAAFIHANAEFKNWGEKAYSHFLEYIKMTDELMTEEARVYAECKGLEEPPSKRAWGAIVLRAAREGFVIKVGHEAVTNKKGHCGFASVWKVLKNK